MKFFLAMSNQNKSALQPITDAIKSVVENTNDSIVPVFVYRQDKAGWSKSELMRHAFDSIDEADALIVEMSTKEVGVGIEMGYAYATKMPILGIRRVGSEPSTTMEGTLTVPIIEYDGLEDLANKLNMGIDQLRGVLREGKIPKEYALEGANLLLEIIEESAKGLSVQLPEEIHVDGINKLKDLQIANEMLLALSINSERHDDSLSEEGLARRRNFANFVNENRTQIEVGLHDRVQQTITEYDIPREIVDHSLAQIIQQFWNKPEGEKITNSTELRELGISIAKHREYI